MTGDYSLYRFKRGGPDFWVKTIESLCVIVWLLMLIALLVIGTAKPEIETFFGRYYNIPLRRTWDLELTRYVFYIMILGMFLSVFGLIVNSKRIRRKEDSYRDSLVIVGIISFIGIIKYLFFF